jgi:putative Mn2+ efflux pump MntP
MSLTSIFAIAVALAMDAVAVSLNAGIGLGKVTIAQVLRMAGTFGVFQFLMPLTGWFLGKDAQKYVDAYDHWLAFALLAFVGGRMILQSLKKRGQDDGNSGSDPTGGGTLLLLAIATSVDALAVGFSLALLGENILYAAGVIGLVCFCLSTGAMCLGSFVRGLPRFRLLGDRANIAGGVILIGIGCKILYEHGVFV